MDNKNILGYKPDLNIYSRPENKQSPEDLYLETQEGQDLYGGISSSSFSFISNLPSEKVEKAKNILEIIDSTIEEFRDHLSSNNVSIVDKITKEHFESTEESTEAEAYVELVKIRKELDEITDEFIICFYGKDVDVSDLKELDEDLKDYIVANEKLGNYEKINYFSMVYDAQVSLIFDTISGMYLDTCIGLGNVRDKKVKRPVLDEEKELYTKKFKTNNDTISNAKYQDGFNLNNMRDHMHNVFVKKSKANSYLDTMGSDTGNYKSNILLREIRLDMMDDADESMEGICKSYKLKEICYRDIYEGLNKKSELRSYF